MRKDVWKFTIFCLSHCWMRLSSQMRRLSMVVDFSSSAFSRARICLSLWNLTWKSSSFSDSSVVSQTDELGGGAMGGSWARSFGVTPSRCFKIIILKNSKIFFKVPDTAQCDESFSAQLYQQTTADPSTWFESSKCARLIGRRGVDCIMLAFGSFPASPVDVVSFRYLILKNIF